jgi:putative ABC transport system permease protein
MLGVQPLLGRLWSADEDLPGQDHVVLLSYATWKEQFGGDKGAIGKSVLRTSDRVSYTIIGVLPPDFQFVSDGNAVWSPPNINTGAPTRFHDQFVFARLKPGTTLAQAQSSMDSIARQMEKEFPASNTGWGVTVRPLQEYYSSLSNTRTALLVLLAAVAALLLIACANVANLLLARATARQQEIAVRVALGASRLRLARQLLTEGLLLGLLGGLAGFAFAWTGFAWLLSIAPAIPTFQPHAIRIDLAVFLFSMMASFSVSVLFGLAPALRVSRKDSNELMRQASRGARGGRRDRSARNALVISEIALAVSLMIGSALLIQSLRNLAQDQLGFASDHLLNMTVCCLDEARYPTQPEITTFWRQTFDRVNALPGVEAATSTSSLPLRGFDGSGSPILIQGRPAPPPGHDTLADQNYVGPNYFSVMKIPMLRGREIGPQDDDTHALVAVVNEAMVRRYWPDQDPIGQQVQLVNSRPFGRWFNIVGVASNSRDRELGRETRPTVYVSSAQNLARAIGLLVRTKSDPAAMAANVRSALHSVKADLSFGRARTLDDLLSDSLSPQRFSVTLLTLFTIIALGLAVVGVYGVMTYMVAQRTHEIGLRMALGAKPGDMLKLVVGQGFRLASVGVTAGLAGALASTRLMKSLLFGISAHDPLTALAVSGALIVVALLACYLPARRAMKVDPMIALRCE